jgi:hypothetical protein
VSATSRSIGLVAKIPLSPWAVAIAESSVFSSACRAG